MPARTRPSRRDAGSPAVSTAIDVGVADRVAGGVQHADGEMIGVQIHPQHPATAQLIEVG